MVSETHQTLYQTLGLRIRREREKKGLTQEALGKQVRLSRTSVTNVEQGRQTIQVHQLVEFARALDVEASVLLPPAKRQSVQIPPEIAHLVVRLTRGKPR